MSEPIYIQIRASILFDLLHAAGRISNPTAAYNPDQLTMAREVIASNQGDAAIIEEALKCVLIGVTDDRQKELLNE